MADEDEDACNLHTRKLLIFRRWRIEEKLTSGGFGAIYRAHDDVDKQNPKVIIKTERRVGKDYLSREEKVYKQLVGVDGFPRMYLKGRIRFTSRGKKKACTALVMETLGPSLSDLFYQRGKRFTLKTVLMLGDQMIKRLEQIHDAGILHRDIKPGNFVMGVGENAHKVYLIDFGLANFYKENGKHVEYREDAPFRGTHRYASLNAHMKIEQSRRDDLEGLGHVLIYFLKGGLPWQNVDCSRRKRRKVIGQAKAAHPINKLCERLPSEFQEYMMLVRHKLAFQERPDYRHLRKLFRRCMKKLGLKKDYVYDWTQKQQINDTSSTTTLASLNNGDSLSSFSSDPILVPPRQENPHPDDNIYEDNSRKRQVIDLVDDNEELNGPPTKKARLNNGGSRSHGFVIDPLRYLTSTPQQRQQQQTTSRFLNSPTPSNRLSISPIPYPGTVFNQVSPSNNSMPNQQHEEQQQRQQQLPEPEQQQQPSVQAI